jgi:septum formation protein
MVNDQLKDFNVILASQSPRRHYLLKELGIDFEIKTKDVEEIWPDHLQREAVAVYLAELKAAPFKEELTDNDLVITSDTIVCLDDAILNKPKDFDDAVRMLTSMSGRKHTVFTGVCLTTKHKTKSFFAETTVYFKALTAEEIEHYITTYQPFDKAGSYGVQEWMGYVGMEHIEGCFFNVMGLPLNKLYTKLEEFLK